MYKTPKELYLEWKEERDTALLHIKLPWWYAIVLLLSIVLICFAGPLALSGAFVALCYGAAITAGILLLDVWATNNDPDIKMGRSQFYKDQDTIINSNLSESEKEELLRKNRSTSGAYGSVHGIFGGLFKLLKSFISFGPIMVVIAVVVIISILYKNFRGNVNEIHFAKA